jgi:hypothetical protein
MELKIYSEITNRICTRTRKLRNSTLMEMRGIAKVNIIREMIITNSMPVREKT